MTDVKEESNKLYNCLCEKARSEDAQRLQSVLGRANTMASNEYGVAYVDMTVNLATETGRVENRIVNINVQSFIDALTEACLDKNKKRREEAAVSEFLRSVQAYKSHIEYLQDFVETNND